MTHHDTAIDHTRQALANLAHGNIEEAQKQLEKALQAVYAMQIKGGTKCSEAPVCIGGGK